MITRSFCGVCKAAVIANWKKTVAFYILCLVKVFRAKANTHVYKKRIKLFRNNLKINNFAILFYNIY